MFYGGKKIRHYLQHCSGLIWPNRVSKKNIRWNLVFSIFRIDSVKTSKFVSLTPLEIFLPHPLPQTVQVCDHNAKLFITQNEYLMLY
jgi:hypothetical protein